MKTKIEVINYLISKYKYKSYLEIGVRSPHRNFDQIIIQDKEGVDPNPSSKCMHIMTSDDFFKQNKKTYDIILIDGLHLASQVEKDIINSLNFLSKDGIIVMHDCNPIKEQHQLKEIQSGVWNGNVWEAFAKFRMNRTDLSMHVINIDHGTGIIKKGSQELFPHIKHLNYKFLEDNRAKLLNLITPDEFKKIY